MPICIIKRRGEPERMAETRVHRHPRRRHLRKITVFQISDITSLSYTHEWAVCYITYGPHYKELLAGNMMEEPERSHNYLTQG